MTKLLQFVLFAEDTNLLASNNDLNSLCEAINEEVLKTDVWFKINKLSLNVKRTIFMIFTRKHIQVDVELHTNNEKIERVYCTKSPGVIIDDKFSYFYAPQFTLVCISNKFDGY